MKKIIYILSITTALALGGCNQATVDSSLNLLKTTADTINTVTDVRQREEDRKLTKSLRKYYDRQ